MSQRLPTPHFEEIRGAVCSYVAACFGEPRSLGEAEICELLVRRKSELVNFSPGGMLVPKREQVPEFNRVHRSVADAFAAYEISHLIDGIDLPINVRLVYGDAPRTRAAAFSSSKLHSDVWAGVPADAVVVVLPVLGDIRNLTIVCGEMRREQELGAMRAMSDYDEGRSIKMAVPYRDMALEHGTMFLGDMRLLHQTVRRRPDGVRVSIDFRFRLNDDAYRALAPTTDGPESLNTRVAYSTWQSIGRDEAIVFDETMAEAAEVQHLQSSLPVYDGSYRIVSVRP
jgi:hypothetical protein